MVDACCERRPWIRHTRRSRTVPAPLPRLNYKDNVEGKDCECGGRMNPCGKRMFGEGESVLRLAAKDLQILYH